MTKYGNGRLNYVKLSKAWIIYLEVRFLNFQVIQIEVKTKMK